MRAVRRGDDRAFEQLFSRYRRRVSAYVHGLVGDHGRAEDITQEVFIAALRRLRETERPIAFRPWIYEIARNACIDEYRRARRANLVPVDDEERERGMQVPRLADDGSPEVRWEQKEQLENLRGAISGLSPQHHQILVLRELEGLTYDAIGARMGMTRTEVESTLFRARRRLSQEYDELVSGRRCHDVRTAVDQQSVRALASRGIRERRRIAHHLEYCHDCMRYARANGVDGADLRVPGLAGRAAAFLPLGWLRLLWPSRRSGWLGPGGGQGLALGRIAAGATAALIAGGVPAAIVLDHHHATRPRAGGTPIAVLTMAPGASGAMPGTRVPAAIHRTTVAAHRARTTTAAAGHRPTKGLEGRRLPSGTGASATVLAASPGRAVAHGSRTGTAAGATSASAVTNAPTAVGSRLTSAGGTVLASTGSAVAGTLNATAGTVQQTVSTAAGTVTSLLPTITAPTVAVPSTVSGPTLSASTPAVTSAPSLTVPVISATIPLLSPTTSTTPVVTTAAPARDTSSVSASAPSRSGGSPSGPVPLVQLPTVAPAP